MPILAIYLIIILAFVLVLNKTEILFILLWNIKKEIYSKKYMSNVKPDDYYLYYSLTNVFEGTTIFDCCVLKLADIHSKYKNMNAEEIFKVLHDTVPHMKGSKLLCIENSISYIDIRTKEKYIRIKVPYQIKFRDKKKTTSLLAYTIGIQA